MCFIYETTLGFIAWLCVLGGMWFVGSHIFGMSEGVMVILTLVSIVWFFLGFIFICYLLGKHEKKRISS